MLRILVLRTRILDIGEGFDFSFFCVICLFLPKHKNLRSTDDRAGSTSKDFYCSVIPRAGYPPGIRPQTLSLISGLVLGFCFAMSELPKASPSIDAFKERNFHEHFVHLWLFSVLQL
jgi:hypothetical protein